MQQYWVDINGNNEGFWEHEWAAHGTCLSTLERSCLPANSPTGAEVILYSIMYDGSLTELFKTLPTYTFLANAGIVPSPTQTYTLAMLITGLKSSSGGVRNVLTGISWYFNLQGSLLDGTFIPISMVTPLQHCAIFTDDGTSDAPSKTSCPSTGINYPPKAILPGVWACMGTPPPPPTPPVTGVTHPVLILLISNATPGVIIGDAPLICNNRDAALSSSGVREGERRGVRYDDDGEDEGCLINDDEGKAETEDGREDAPRCSVGTAPV
ncbi:hypothetical protein DXG01_005533 [Tephrocybe rancida]|nr:hypothetical protein DXG01_005533 [Tephrocybe rancida]